MLTVTIPEVELWDERIEQFVYVKACTLTLEHSLVSLSKWESRWNKPFIGNKDITHEETLDYIRCMTITQNVNPDVYVYIPDDVLMQINNYISAPMTATTFKEEKNKGGRKEIITAEIIYYWMVALQIPFDPCQKWHLNRLLTLINVCNIKNTPPKKRSKRDIMSANAQLNAARRQQLGSKG